MQKLNNFRLSDQSDSHDGDRVGDVEVNSLGVGLKFKGYTTTTSEDDIGEIVLVEVWEGELRVVIWSDINSEDPTHIISLEGARNEKRVIP